MQYSDRDREPLIKSNEVRRLFGEISRSTERRWISAGFLPAPRKINGHNYYLTSEVVLAYQRLTGEKLDV